MMLIKRPGSTLKFQSYIIKIWNQNSAIFSELSFWNLEPYILDVVAHIISISGMKIVDFSFEVAIDNKSPLNNESNVSEEGNKCIAKCLEMFQNVI